MGPICTEQISMKENVMNIDILKESQKRLEKVD